MLPTDNTSLNQFITSILQLNFIISLSILLWRPLCIHFFRHVVHPHPPLHFNPHLPVHIHSIPIPFSIVHPYIHSLFSPSIQCALPSSLSPLSSQYPLPSSICVPSLQSTPLSSQYALHLVYVCLPSSLSPLSCQYPPPSSICVPSLQSTPSMLSVCPPSPVSSPSIPDCGLPLVHPFPIPILYSVDRYLSYDLTLMVCHVFFSSNFQRAHIPNNLYL